MTSITPLAAGATLELRMLKAAMGQPAAAAQLVAPVTETPAPPAGVSEEEAAAMLAAAMGRLASRSAAQALLALEATQPEVPQVSSD